MTSSTKSVEGWSLPQVFSADHTAALVDGFMAELCACPDPDAKYAAAIGALSPEQVEQYQEAQKTHFRYLLSPILDESKWRRATRILGQENARYGIPVESISKTYGHFARHVSVQLNAARFSRVETEEFLSGLSDRLFRDLSMQAEAYSSAYSQELRAAVGENTRATALYRALMSTAELVVRAQNEREMSWMSYAACWLKANCFPQVWVARPTTAEDLELNPSTAPSSRTSTGICRTFIPDDEAAILSRARVAASRSCSTPIDPHRRSRTIRPSRTSIANKSAGGRGGSALPGWRSVGAADTAFA